MIANFYYDNILNPLVSMPDRLPDSANAYHLFPVLCEKRDELQAYLTQKEIGTVIHYPIPPHKQECYKKWNECSLPITEYIADHELSLPIGPTITLEEAAEVVKAVNEFRG